VPAGVLSLTARSEHTDRFVRFVHRHRRSRYLQLFVRAMGNGQVRHFVQVPARLMPAFARSFGARQHVIGLFQVRHRATDHAYLRIGVRVYHLEREIDGRGCEHWSMNDGGRPDRFREGSQTITERLIQLRAPELRRLRAHVAAMEADMRVHGGEMAFRGNCISVWTRARIGEQGEDLAALAGIADRDYAPLVMRQLVVAGNRRVIGVAIYPARGRELRRIDRIRLGWW